MKLEKRYFTTKVRPKDIVKYLEINYSKARDTKLNEDEHQYLINTLLLILEEQKKLDTAERRLGLWDKETMWNSLAFNETMLFSVRNYPESIRALSLYAVYKRIPMQSYQYEEEYDRIMTPVVKMYEDGAFIDVYRTKNPKVTKGVRENDLILPNVEEMKEKGFELVESEAIDMPYKRLSEYLHKEENKMLIGDKLSLFTWTNINNKVRCFCSNVDRVREALERYPDDIEGMMREAGFEHYLLPLQQKTALETMVVDGPDAMAQFIATEITLNADLLY